MTVHDIKTVSLSNVRVLAAASEETFAFTAYLHVNGVRVGSVSNDGHGGANRLHVVSRELEATLDAWAETQPPHFAFGATLPMTLDLWISLQVEADEYRQRIGRLCKSATYFRLLTDPPDKWRRVEEAYSPDLRARIAARFPDRHLEYLNDRLTEAQAHG